MQSGNLIQNIRNSPRMEAKLFGVFSSNVRVRVRKVQSRKPNFRREKERDRERERERERYLKYDVSMTYATFVHSCNVYTHHSGPRVAILRAKTSLAKLPAGTSSRRGIIKGWPRMAGLQIIDTISLGSD